MTQTQEETKTILMRELIRAKRQHDWLVVGELDLVPTSVGHYALYDGITIRGCGVSWNMRKSAQEILESKNPEIPIFMYLPDVDGKAVEWLNQRI